MFTLAGETWEGGDGSKCPGETNCNDWNEHQGPADETHDAKEESICHGCPKFESKPASPDGEDQIEPEEIEDLVKDVEDIVRCEDGGSPTDWSCYPFQIFVLVKEWRDAERHVRELRDRNFAALVKGFLK